MVNKLRAIFFSFAATILVLFAVFVFLMTTVNPPRDPNASSNATEAVTDAPETEPPAPPADGILRRFMDYTTKSVAVTFNEEIMSKGRRSINDQRTTKNDGLVIMKVVDDEGRPRIEVVLYPRWADSKWKIYRMDNILDPKNSEADLLPSSIFLNDDTIVVENDEFSPKWDLNSYTTTKSVRRNEMAISLDSQEMTTVDTILPTESKSTLPLDSPITNTAINPNDVEQDQTQIETKNINTDNVFSILTKTTFSTPTNKVSSPETIIDTNITNVTAVLLENFETKGSDTSNTIEETTEIPKGTLLPGVDSVQNVNYVTIKDVSTEPVMERITEVTAVSSNTETSDTSDTIEETTGISKDISADVDPVDNSNDVTIKDVSSEPMMEQITEVTTISLNTEAETTTEATILETNTE